MDAFLIALALNSATVNLGLPPDLLTAICYTESNGVIDPPRVDDGGSPSIGMCQVKHATARGVGFKGTQDDLAVPGNNIYQAGKILKYHLNKCKKLDLAIMAYNTGSCYKHNTRYLRKVLTNVRSKH